MVWIGTVTVDAAEDDGKRNGAEMQLNVSRHSIGRPRGGARAAHATARADTPPRACYDTGFLGVLGLQLNGCMQ